MRKKVFDSIVKESALYMFFSGIAMGILFLPISRFILGLPAREVFTLWYSAVSVGAGLLVSGISFLVIRLVIIKKLNSFSENIKRITENILRYKRGNIESIDECDDCYIRLYSKDVLGELAGRYNSLVRVIRSLFWQYEMMDKFFLLVSRSLEVNELDSKTAQFVVETTNALGVEIYRLKKDGQIELAHAKNIRTHLSEERKASLIDIIEEGKIVDLKDKDVTVVEFGTGSLKPAEVIYFPFRYEDLMGVLVMYNKSYLHSDKVVLVERLLSEYVLALKSAFSYQQMQQLAAFDELTGLYNRRFGMQRLYEEYKRAKRLKTTLCVIMFDLDHFKHVNDTYGHQAGDYLLSAFARILKENFREEDVVMRYGGEEFLCALNNTREENSCQRADDLRRKVEETQFVWRGNVLKITVSCGIAGVKPDEENKTLSDLIKEADERLYVAKNSGRNRCIGTCLTG